MKITFYAPLYFEKWNYENPDKVGSGGSEISVIEMAWRLAARGHDVTAYSPTPPKTPSEWRGVKWLNFRRADFSQPGLWIIYRNPPTIDKFIPKRKDQEVWLVGQDVHYPNWNDERIERLDKYIPLSQAHADYTISVQPKLKDKISISSNGIKKELIEQIEKENITRNPLRIMHASSPDRGMKQAILAFRKAREFVPKLELHLFYGFDRIKMIVKQNPHSWFGSNYKELKRLIRETKGVYSHGRLPQAELIREWFKSGIYFYVTDFFETSNISSMEAQACGAVPVFSPIFAQGENIKHGVGVFGESNDPLTISRAAAEIARLALQPQLQEQIRPEMMAWARERFNWERWVDQWESWMYPQFAQAKGDYIAQYNFQIKHAKGKILNVGCDIDAGNLKNLGAVNVDIVKFSPITKFQTRADIIADARNLPESLHNKFDTVILGDILEHMNDRDILKSLASAKKCLTENGQIIVTCPDDLRDHSDVPETHENSDYAEGIPAYHTRSITKEYMENLFNEAGLKVLVHQEIDYTFFSGNGFVIC